MIAEPNDFVVKEIKSLTEALTKPKRVIEYFKTKVVGIKKYVPLKYALEKMYPNSNLQLPVLDENEKVIDILNNNTIARWLADKIENNGEVMTNETMVSQVLNYKENDKNYKFINANMPIYEAFDIFLKILK